MEYLIIRNEHFSCIQCCFFPGTLKRHCTYVKVVRATDGMEEILLSHSVFSTKRREEQSSMRSSEPDRQCELNCDILLNVRRVT